MATISHINLTEMMHSVGVRNASPLIPFLLKLWPVRRLRGQEEVFLKHFQNSAGCIVRKKRKTGRSTFVSLSLKEKKRETRHLHVRPAVPLRKQLINSSSVIMSRLHCGPSALLLHLKRKQNDITNQAVSELRSFLPACFLPHAATHCARSPA